MDRKALLVGLVAVLGLGEVKAQEAKVAFDVAPARQDDDGALGLKAGSDAAVTVLGLDPSQWICALYVFPAEAVGHFQFLDSGLLFYGLLDKTRALTENVRIPLGLEGMLISAQAYAFDGRNIEASPVRTCRIF